MYLSLCELCLAHHSIQAIRTHIRPTCSPPAANCRITENIKHVSQLTCRRLSPSPTVNFYIYLPVALQTLRPPHIAPSVFINSRPASQPPPCSQCRYHKQHHTSQPIPVSPSFAIANTKLIQTPTCCSPNPASPSHCPSHIHRQPIRNPLCSHCTHRK